MNLPTRASRVFVAGHSGLLGSSLLRVLAAAGFRELRTRTRQELDLADPRAVRAAFLVERPEVVFLAAGLTGGILANARRPADFLHANLVVQDAVFEAALACGTATLVFYGSSCVYPRDCARPICEDALGTGAVEATSAAYAAAKTAGIAACEAYNRQYGTTRFLALVPNSLYGPGDNFDPESSHVLAALVGRFHAAKVAGAPSVTLWGTGEPRREFLFVDDAARASMFAVLNADRLENRHYNLGSGRDLGIADLARLVAAKVGYGGEILWDTAKPDGPARKLLDSSSFRALGWSPEVSLESGLASTYDWYLKRLSL